MKILLVNKYFNMHGGSETYFFGLADLLRQAGHEVIFFAMQDEKNLPCEQSAYFVSNVEFNGELTAAQKLKAAFRMVYSFEAKKKISALIEKEKPDIIHINLFHRVLTASIVDAAKKHGIPLLAQMPIDPQLAALTDEGRIEEFNGDWLADAVTALEAR